MSSSTNTNNVNKTGAPPTDVICVCRGAPLLFTLFVFVEELMSCLRYLCLLEYFLSYFTLFVNKTNAPPTNTNNENKTRSPPTNTNNVNKTGALLQTPIT
jgi:hypothetical protein